MVMVMMAGGASLDYENYLFWLLHIGEMAKTRPGGFSLALYSLLRIDTSFFGCGLLYVPYVPYGV